jgi:hypothetical protein
MIAIAHFAGLVLTTMFAAAAAVFLDWLFLRAMFQLMRPAAASHAQSGPLRKAGPTTASTFGAELVHGTRQIARHFGPAAVRR